jgi:hypothetical protein
MERLGLQRAALFNWQKSGRATLNVYKEVANANREVAGSQHYTGYKRERRAVSAGNRKR